MALSLKERFIKKVKQTKTCWLWTGAVDGKGYGQIWKDNKGARASRVAWELFVGIIPKNMWVLHKCDNPLCVNPDHLFLGTQIENMADMVRKGRQNKAFGENSSGHKLTELEVLEIRKLYKTGKFSQRKLAKMFGLRSHMSINYVLRKHTWKHI